MPRKQTVEPMLEAASNMTPLVAATLAGVIYQARLANRQSKVNIPDNELISEVVGLWRTVRAELGQA